MTAAPEGTNDSGNGRVTLAVLGSKMDDLNETVRDLVKEFKADHDRTTVLCTKQERMDTWLKAMVAAVIGTIVAQIGAWFKQ